MQILLDNELDSCKRSLILKNNLQARTFVPPTDNSRKPGEAAQIDNIF